MIQPVFDKPEQLEQVKSGLLDDENVLAVYDAIGVGTGFLALTTRRVIVQNKSFVGNRVALTSIPYARVTSVSVIGNKSWVGHYFSGSSIALTVGTHVYEVEFRGEAKAHDVHNAILARIS